MSIEINMQDVLTMYMENKEVSNSPTEKHMRSVMQSYIDNLNNKDADAIFNLYAENASCEDPVGTKPIVGNETLKHFIREGLSAMKKAELVAPIRTSPGNCAAMAFSIHMDFGGQEVIIQVVDVMKFNEEGKIIELKAYWGKDDVKIIRGEIQDFLAIFMKDKKVVSIPSEEHMKNVMQSYIDNINKKDADAFLSLFADNMVGEDPVGTKPIVGLKNLAAFVKQGMASKVELVAPIRTSLGNSAAMAFDIYMELEGQDVIIQTIDVMKFNEAGKIIEAKAYWGKDNFKVN